MTQAKDNIYVIMQGEFIKCYSEGEYDHHGEKTGCFCKKGFAGLRFWLSDLE